MQVIETRKTVLGQEHPDTLTSMSNLALTYQSQGRWKEAEELEVQVMQTSLTVLGEEHPDTLALTFKGQGRDEEAMVLMEECTRIQKPVLGPEHKGSSPGTLWGGSLGT